MTRGGNHYSRMHFWPWGALKTTCGRESENLQVIHNREEWHRMERRAAGDLCAACRANVRLAEEARGK